MYLSYGDRNELVLEVQRLLNKRGFRLAEDGIFGPKTSRAVRLYQVSQGLYPTGIVTGVTLALLRAVDRLEEEILLGVDPAFLSPNAVLEALRLTNLEYLAEDFYNVAYKYNLKVGYIVAHAALETGWGRSRIFKEKNNLFGFLAYDYNPGNARAFSSPRQAMEVYAEYIRAQYLSPEGKWFAGATLNGLNVYYATDKRDTADPLTWAEKIASIWRQLRERT